MHLLLPIKPQYVKQIFSGQKRFEFRKIKPKFNIDKIIIYETAPTSAIVGEVSVADIVVDQPEKIWDMTKTYAGLDKKAFDKYYQNQDIAVVFKLEKPLKYTKPKQPDFVPQSYVYLQK